MVLESHIQHHIEGCLNVGRSTPVSLTSTLELVVDIYALEANQGRIAGESDEVILEGTLTTLSDVSAHGNCGVHRLTGHRSRHVNDGDAILLTAIVIVLLVIPVLLPHQTVSLSRSATPSTILEDLVGNIHRIQHRGVNLLGLILGEVGIGLSASLSALNIVTGKSILILHASLGRDLIELDLVPTTLGHQTLKDIDTLTQDRQSLTILLVGHTEITASDIAKTLRLTRRSILGLHPLCEQRRSLALYIQLELSLDDTHSVSLHRSANKNIQVIPTAELRDILQVTTNGICVMEGQILNRNAEETTLTLAAAHITQIEQALQSVGRILCKSLAEEQLHIVIRTITICAAQREHIEQIRLGGTMGDSTILSQSVVVCRLQTVHKSIRGGSPFSHWFLLDKRKIII